MRAGAAYPALRASAAPGLPVASMVLGMPADEAADLLPRLFNLCRAAQGLAARAAFGLTPEPDWPQALRAEITRDHVLKLCLKWPAALNRPALPMPQDWPAGSEAARVALFGATGRLPCAAEDFAGFLAQTAGVAPVLKAIAALFAPGVACRDTLPVARPGAMFDAALMENSVAARHADHAVMRHVERTWGRGPLWSALGVAYDLEAIWQGWLPDAVLQNGCAVVPAARGYYGLKAQVENGVVTSFARITPTDHLLASGGVMDQSLARLDIDETDPRAGVLLSILDPCCPVRLEAAPQGRDVVRERADA